MINRVTLIGRIGRVDISDNPAAPLKFSVATDRNYKDKATGEWVNNTDWHNCNVFTGKDRYKDKLAKGQVVYVDGSIQYDKYTDKNGVEKVSTAINCNYIRVIDKGNTTASESSDVPF